MKTIIFSVSGSIIVLAILVAGAFWQGQKYERQAGQLRLATAVDVVKYLDLPPIVFPEKKGKLKSQPKPEPEYIPVRLPADSLTIDSLQRGIWALKQPQSFTATDSVIAEDGTVVHYQIDVTTRPNAQPDYNLIVFPMNRKEKQVEKLVPVPVDESWTTHPLYVIGGALAGIGIYLIATH